MSIKIKGASEHNLKNISIELPRNEFIVFTGISGSGKSSLAFDTIFAEGQRRYIESLSSYARQFLGQMPKPKVDFVKGLSPAISISQKTSSHNPRSTVGTVTEIYDYLRLLFARVGTQFCHICNSKITLSSPEEICNTILNNTKKDSKFQILAPIVRGRKGSYEKLFDDYRHKGFVRAVIDGKLVNLEEAKPLKRYDKHNIDIVIDRLTVSNDIKSRLNESVETAFSIADGFVTIDYVDENKKAVKKEFGNITRVNSIGRPEIYSSKRACPNGHTLTLDEIETRTFSFNAPYGACENCDGLGYKNEIDPSLIVPDDSLSILDGAIIPWKNQFLHGKWAKAVLNSYAKEIGFSLNAPWKNLSEKIKHDILYEQGYPVEIRYTNRAGFTRIYETFFEGAIVQTNRRYSETSSNYAREKYESFMREIPCSVCNGKRLKDEVLSVKIKNKSIYDVSEMSILECTDFFKKLNFSDEENGASKNKISELILKEINARLHFLLNVGLDYLTLSRSANTLSGGESQRIRLATQIGSGLVGVLYILDEPSIGLHQKDNRKLINTLVDLKDQGNTVIVVEHDEETIRSANRIVDFGPKAGIYGGKVVHNGTIKDLLKNEKSITGQYLSGKKKVEHNSNKRHSNKYITIKGAEANNLKNISVKFPLHTFVCVTGVSGSGKSSLVDEILYKRLSLELNGSKIVPGKHKSIDGIDDLEKVVYVNQQPIGRTPRSNPATYTGVWDKIRNIFASTTSAKEKGFLPGRFSFNTHGGRCEHCKGDGEIKIEMNFLPDVYVVCEVCNGKRYNEQTLSVLYKGKSVSDILEMSITEAADFFTNIPSISKYLETLKAVGLGYIKLGQSATTLSGGEAQRVKLSSELHRKSNGKTVYILDEPTTGLHFDDVNKLLSVLQGLVDKKNTVVIIEHNLDVIKSADYIIDLGPDGGINGGEVVVSGTIEDVKKCKKSYTAKYL